VAEVRIQKVLSRAGVASRREAEALMLQGRVRVNGAVVTTLGTRVDPLRDRVELDGEPVEPERLRWVAFHKPPGTLTTRDDPHGRRTVYDHLPDELASLGYVGRLDRDTEGLLLLSNDGDVVHRLLHPSGEVEREYRAEVEGRPGAEVLAGLEAGVQLEEGPARARRAWLVEKGPPAVVGLVLTEGRKREVRRMLEAVKHPVRRLTRVRFGPIRLEGIEAGAWRELTDEEIRALRLRAEAGPEQERSRWS
jgi:23S rRNA pseudouridine2605 synthase